jgi:hypothetical protein
MIYCRPLTFIGPSIFALCLAHIQYGGAYPLTQATGSIALIGGILHLVDVLTKKVEI